MKNTVFPSTSNLSEVLDGFEYDNSAGLARVSDFTYSQSFDSSLGQPSVNQTVREIVASRSRSRSFRLDWTRRVISLASPLESNSSSILTSRTRETSPESSAEKVEAANPPFSTRRTSNSFSFTS
ncbi:MAG: hypothetical protein VYA07_00555 [Candidatus Thermoplasmatota archaeon]|nr:hypothetical protein [Candidatus Thermoplasmatota archaeon]